MKKIALLLALAFLSLTLVQTPAEAARSARDDIQRMADQHNEAMAYVDLRNPKGRGAGDVVGCKANVFKDHCQVSAEELDNEVRYENAVWPLSGKAGPRIVMEFGQWFDMLKASHPEMTPAEEKWAWDIWARIRSEQWNDAGNNLIVLRQDSVNFDPPPGSGGVGEGGGAKTPDELGNGGAGGMGGMGGGGGSSNGGKLDPKGNAVGASWKSRGVQDLGDENNPDDPAYKVKKMADDAAKKKGNNSTYIPDDSYRLDGVNKYGPARTDD